jgi:hypothetical protein
VLAGIVAAGLRSLSGWCPAADGNTTNDIRIVDDDTFRLRAKRSELGSGRVYTITCEATDSCGNSTVASSTVTVPVGS